VALARALGVPRSAVVVRAGAASRDKLFAVTDPPVDLTERVRALLRGTP
jgi:uncharacterized protein YggU (UPF0235/DUF167 family)